MDAASAVHTTQPVDIPGYVPSLDDIRIEHHPSTNRDPDIYSFEEYCSQGESDAIGPGVQEHLRRFTAPNIADTDSPARPWRPFSTRIDFELAELTLDAHMNGPQIEQLFAILNRIVTPRESGPNVANQPRVHSDSLTLQSGTNLAYVWDLARQTRAIGVSTIAFYKIYLLNILCFYFSSRKRR